MRRDGLGADASILSQHDSLDALFAFVLAGRREEGRRTLAGFMGAFPGRTIADVRSGLPWNAAYLDRTSEGLEGAGMRP